MNSKRHRRPVKRKTANALPFFIIAVAILLAIFVIGQVDIHVGNIRVNYGEPFVDDAKVTWFGFDVTNWADVKGEVDTNKLGVYSMHYSFMLYNMSRTVTVVDLKEPVISLYGDEKITLATMDSYQELGAEAWDNYDGNVTENMTISIDQITPNYAQVIYEVSDSHENIASAIREVEISPGTVYLTFDDGPSGLTASYLDVLKEYGVNATFFVLGFSEIKESWKAGIINRAVEEGNEIGMHGYSHVYSDIYKSKETALANFDTEKNLLKMTVGIEPQVVRFPGGSSNTVSRSVCEGVMTEATKAVVDAGYNYIDWNVDSNDSGSDVKNSDNIYQNVISAVVPKVGARYVVLMHDGGADHSATLEVLPNIIQTLQEKGFVFDVITYETEPVRHGVNN